MQERRADAAVIGSGVPSQSRRRCGRGEPSPGADVAGVSPVLVQMADEERGALERRLRDETHRRTLKILSTGVHVTKVGSPLPHLHRDWAHPCRIGTRTGRIRGGVCTPSSAHGRSRAGALCCTVL